MTKKVVTDRIKRFDRGVSPVDVAISELDGTYYKLTETADILGVSVSTLRRLLKNEQLNAPSKEMRYGAIFVYLYTPEDVDEIRAYIENRRKAGKWRSPTRI